MGTIHARGRRLRKRAAPTVVEKRPAGGNAGGEGLRVRTMRRFPQEIRALREALGPAPERPLSQEQFARLLGISWSTVARWEAGGEPGAQMEQKLRRLRRAVELLGDMVTPESRAAFFEQRHPMLLKLRPIDLLDTSEGAEAVYRALEAAETGAFG